MNGSLVPSARWHVERLTPLVVLLAVTPAHPGAAQSREVTTEFTGPPGSSKPSLTASSSGTLLLSWLEATGENEWALTVTARRDGRWLAPETVARHSRFFVNWADFPSVVETSTGTWLAHWLEKTAGKPYAYHVLLSSSPDRGRTWSAPQTAHLDRSDTEHGFVAMVPGTDGSVAVAWLDGGTMTPEGGSMALRTATWHADGSVQRETVVDGRTCECCQVAMTRSETGLVAAYRDRSDDEVRDIAVSREVDGRWARPVTVHADGFVTRACPVNGPAIDALGRHVVVAWFTVAGGQMQVRAAFSHDGGATFGRPRRIDGGSTSGRVAVRLLEPGVAAVIWLETEGEGAAWQVRRVSATGTMGESRTLGSTSRGRDAGFPRAVAVDGELYVTWSDPGPDARVRVVRLPVASLAR